MYKPVDMHGLGLFREAVRGSGM